MGVEGWFWVVWVAVVAAAVASFTAATVGRVAAGQSLRGRSRCRCGVELSAAALVPVVGWVRSGGRARCCAAPVPWRFPVGEAATAGAAAAVTVAAGPVAGLAAAAAVAVVVAVVEVAAARR